MSALPPSATEDFDTVRLHRARIRSQTVGAYCQRRDTGSSVDCWCMGQGTNGKPNADCPPQDQPAREAGIVTAQPKALPLVTPVPWFPRS